MLNTQASQVTSYRELRLDQSSSLALVVNRHYVTEYCNRPWSRVALKYGLPPQVRGCSILDCVPKVWANSVRLFIDTCLDNLLVQNVTCVIASGRIKRMVEIQIVPVAEGAVISSGVELETILPPGVPLEKLYRNDQDQMQVCGRCYRFRQPEANEWHWVPSLISTAHENVLSTLCPSCESGSQ